jgi:tetratricopeptide (TPR) repeat protein
MRDSLDLAELKEQIQKTKDAADERKNVSNIAGRGLVVVTIIFIPLIFVSEFFSADGDRFLNLVWYILALITLALIGWFGVLAYRQLKQLASRMTKYAPSFVIPPNHLAILGELRVYAWIFVVIAPSLFFIQQLFQFILVIFVPFLPLLLYRRFMYWVSKGGLPRIERMQRVFPNNSTLLHFQAISLLNIGQVVEAEHTFRALLSRKYHLSIGTIPLLLNNLGYCLTLVERYDEALPILEAAIRIDPSTSSSFDSLAQWYLQQNLDPERALELTEIAIANTKSELIDSIGVQHATSAHAAALTGRISRAKALLSQALQAIDKVQPSTAAEINRQVGYAYLAMGDEQAARTHFTRAVELDPNGLYGKLAQRAFYSLPSA